MMMNIQYTSTTSSLIYLIILVMVALLTPYLISENINIYNYFYINYFYNYIKLYDIHLISILLYSGFYSFIYLIGLILWTILLGILGFNK